MLVVPDMLVLVGLPASLCFALRPAQRNTSQMGLETPGAYFDFEAFFMVP